MKRDPSELKPESWVVAAGRPEDPGAPLNVPPVPASNFLLGADRAYARDEGTETWAALEEILGGLESAQAISFASGMAAVAAVFDQVPAGATVVLPDDCYQAVVALAEAGERRRGWTVQRIAVEATEAWIQACAVADLIWLESVSNPLLAVADLEAIGAAPRKPGAILAVDSTFATPLNQQPLELGATVSVQSVTKFIGGHSDLLAGVVATRDDAVTEGLRASRLLHGATIGALEAFLATRGARTLALRLRQAEANAARLVEHLEAHPAVTRVRYPGLPSHATHDVARRVLKGFGTMLSFELRGGAHQAEEVCRRLQLIHHATSLGGVESTIERRAAIAGQEHLPPTLLRLSVGIENAEDLWADLEAAFASVFS